MTKVSRGQQWVGRETGRKPSLPPASGRLSTGPASKMAQVEGSVSEQCQWEEGFQGQFEPVSSRACKYCPVGWLRCMRCGLVDGVLRCEWTIKSNQMPNTRLP
ncbi:uncharacterized protein HMPREF1120_08596 [Exophiala dermatitidis NIH/UT8656]|uniref:Uncharacterized protein n=1 Tax=Exophiala dermatitidis (strain ATCC 34100 / CBS 525.76 / NIH/UT8656) TaxID=858893 RepID=H6C967_EXODN|nr:uncharacterized protein HMPREF1120_08596 [Exophiala dermatitidis NIH/UT8656]EHY60644.1 hypothetical protein HMPREF1120_08596 [Exophiala dermatitidis NIH/UT8656]